MSSPLLAALLLAAQATNPTKEREVVIPEGLQWLNLGPLKFRDVELRGQYARTGMLSTELPLLEERRSTGFMTEYSRLQVGDFRQDGFTVGASWDFNAFRLSADFFFGDWEGAGTLRYSLAMQPETVVPLAMSGDALGLRFGFEWPAIRFLSPVFEVDLGPKLGVNWYHQSFASPAASPYVFTDTHHNELVGSIGPRLSVRVNFDRFYLALEAELDWLFDALRGVEERYGLAVGLRF